MVSTPLTSLVMLFVTVCMKYVCMMLSSSMTVLSLLHVLSSLRMIDVLIVFIVLLVLVLSMIQVFRRFVECYVTRDVAVCIGYGVYVVTIVSYVVVVVVDYRECLIMSTLSLLLILSMMFVSMMMLC